MAIRKHRAKRHVPRKAAKKAIPKKKAAPKKKSFLYSSAEVITHEAPFVKPIRHSIETAGAVRVADVARPKFTGKELVVLSKQSTTKQFLKYAGNVSMKMASSRDFQNDTNEDMIEKALTQADGIVFEKLKVAVINKDGDQRMRSLSASSTGRKTILRTEPERFVYASASKKKSITYSDNAVSTWGLQVTAAINAIAPHSTGKGIRIAILDTGFNMSHPDFTGRIKGSKSFVQNSPIEDGNGHGTHCAGIAAGKIQTGSTLRYGVATGADLYIAKVLSNRGQGRDSGILAAIEWAIENNCQVVSMSLGSEIDPGEKYYESYETAAKEALKNKCLLIASAGNESNRPRRISPVNHPANCPSIMAVGSVDQALNISYFSCGGTTLGQVDIAGPGEEIFSSWRNGKYKLESGTSMATPFVAGIAALLYEKHPSYSAKQVRAALLRKAKKLNIKKADVGAGLVCFK